MCQLTPFLVRVDCCTSLQCCDESCSPTVCRAGQHSLVGVGMVVVVLDPPGLKGIDEGGKHQGAHNVLYQLVLAEGAVATVMTHHKELQAQQVSQNSRRFGPADMLWLLQCGSPAPAPGGLKTTATRQMLLLFLQMMQLCTERYRCLFCPV